MSGAGNPSASIARSAATDAVRIAGCVFSVNCNSSAGPSKHNNSQGFYLYSYEPGGNRVEVYAGSYLVFAPDWEPVTWNEEERGTGVYWGAPLPESFLTYGTPDIAGAREVAAEKLTAFDPL